MKIIYILSFLFLFGTVNAQKIPVIDKASATMQAVIKDTAIANRFDMIKNIYDGLAEVSLNDKWGYIDQTGAVVVPVKYDDLAFFSNGLYKVRIKEEMGILNKTGRIIVPFGYDSIFLSSSKDHLLVLARRDTMLDAFDSEGKILFSCIYKKNKEIYSRDLIIVTKDKLKGIVDYKDRIVFPIEYSDIKIVRNNIFLNKNRLYSVADLEGNIVLSEEYGRFVPMQHGKWFTYQCKDSSYVIMDEHFKVLYPLKVHIMFNETDSMFIVVNNNKYSIGNKYGVMSLTGKIIIPLEYADIRYAGEGLFLALRKLDEPREYEYISASGNVKINIKTEVTNTFQDGLCIVKTNKKYGCINNLGKFIIPPVYNSLYYMNYKHPLHDSTGTFRARKEDFYGIVGKDGKVLVPLKYLKVYVNKALSDDGSFCYAAYKDEKAKEIDYYTPEGVLLKVMNASEKYWFSLICKDVYWARSYADGLVIKTKMLNAQGKILYETDNTGEIDLHYNKFIVLQSKLKWGIIDTSGKVILPFIYDKLIPLSLKLFIAVKDGKYGMVDIFSGQEVIPFTYTLLDPYYNQTFIASDGNFYGCLDYQGNIFLPFEYDKILNRLPCKKIVAYKNGKCGVLDLNKEVLIPFKYEKIHYYQDKNSFVVSKNGYQEIYSVEGKPLQSNEYTSILSTNEGIFLLRKKSMSFIADASGKLIDSIKCERIESLGGGFYIIYVKNPRKNELDINGNMILYLQGLYSLEKKMIFPCIYEKIKFIYQCRLEDGSTPVWLSKNNFVSMANVSGDIIIPFEKKFIDISWNEAPNYVLVRNGQNKIGYYTLEGEEAVPVMYDVVRKEFDKEKETPVYHFQSSNNGTYLFYPAKK